MSQNLRWRILVVLLVLVASLYFSFPLEEKINLGLDLKGGMHLILKVETEKLEANARTDAVIRAIEILRNRIDGLGVGETVIQRQGEDQIIVQLPGITDREAALTMIGKVAQLNFHLVNDNPQMFKEALEGKMPQGFELKYSKDDNEPILIESQPALKGDTIADARVDFDSAGLMEPKISLSFNSKGADKFSEITRKHTKERLAIVLDGEVLSAPEIREPILSGQGEITGQFTYEKASLLALSLRSGSLPAPMTIQEERTIGPLLGKDSINAGIMATIVGIALVLGFMIIYYLTAGVIADIALIFNLFMILGTMGLLKILLPNSQVTLTLPGIAGIILTLGMAVDANVLINERIREEIRIGRPLHAAISSGYSKAFSAIIDSNITTLVAAFMLFQFGSGPIKGFAVTLTIGLTVSLFTALYVTRTIFLILLDLNLLKSLPMLQFFADTKFNFIAIRRICFILSILIIAAGLTSLITKGDKAYGIDFAGGQIQEYRFKQPISTEELRNILKEIGWESAIIQRFNQEPENVIIRTGEDSYDSVVKALKERIPNNEFEVLRVERVGPIVGKALRQRALFAIIFAMIGILIYVGIRFKHFDFAAAGVIALVHDVIVALGVLVMLGREVDLLVITALLTIAGYSINDTIVIYDRIRENLNRFRKMDLGEIINLSVNQTLGRTFLTTFATLLVVVSLYFLGGEVLNSFALCLIIGFISGTYSTIFIASPLVLAWQKK